MLPEQIPVNAWCERWSLPASWIYKYELPGTFVLLQGVHAQSSHFYLFYPCTCHSQVIQYQALLVSLLCKQCRNGEQPQTRLHELVRMQKCTLSSKTVCHHSNSDICIISTENICCGSRRHQQRVKVLCMYLGLPYFHLTNQNFPIEKKITVKLYAC